MADTKKTETRVLMRHDIVEMIRLGVIKDQHPIIQQLAEKMLTELVEKPNDL